MIKRIITSITIMIAAILIFSISAYAAGVEKGDTSTVDSTNASKGNIQITFTGTTDKAIKVTIEKGAEKYTYDLNNKGITEYYPLQMGNGVYKVKVLENTTGSKYTVIQTSEFDITLESEYAPYLVPNQMISYSNQSNAVKEASKITGGASNELDKVSAIYEYVVQNVSYDYNKAATVQSGYVPNVDSVLSSKSGICFDFASLLSAMCRSQNIPTKLVMGYVAPNGVYHAWNEVFIKEVGWVKVGNYQFDGKTWKLMDPTFTSSSNNSPESEKIIGNSSNYSKKYQY